MSQSLANGKVQSGIEEKLRQSFAPQFMAVENESHNHSVPANSETHFKVVLVSSEFSDKRLVARHQSVYRVLDDELKNGVHALALHLYTEDEWQAKHMSAPDSPNCMGGSKQDG